jgi:hypothetical protein
MIVSPEWYFPFRLSNSDFVHMFHCPMHATYPTFHIHDIIIAIIFCEEYKLESFTLYSFFPIFLSLHSSQVQISP